MKRFSLILFLIQTIIVSFAYDFCVDGIYFNTKSLSGLTCEVTRGTTPYTGEITIPDHVSYDGKEFTVTAIGQRAFYRNYNLKKVNMPTTILSFDYLAFSECSSMESITIPQKVSLIGQSVFEYDSNLKEIICLNPEPPYVYSTTFADVNKTQCVIKVPASAVNSYKEHHI